MFYENRRKSAPLCSQVWGYKDTCDRKCQRMSMKGEKKEGWNNSDKVLLTVLSMFGKFEDLQISNIADINKYSLFKLINFHILFYRRWYAFCYFKEAKENVK